MEMHQLADAPANLESIAPGIIAFYAGFESKQKTFAFERDLKSGLGSVKFVPQGPSAQTALALNGKKTNRRTNIQGTHYFRSFRPPSQRNVKKPRQ